jgi:predicted short-subunit dehydrogenase-like oxidoreductase (DUF2520 family)
MLDKITFSIIGTGNMAQFLAKTLIAKGYIIEGIWGRNKEKTNTLALVNHCSSYPNLDNIPDRENHFCFLALSDTALPDIVLSLNFIKTTLIHTAGASSILILKGAAKNTAVFWPIYSIVSQKGINIDNMPIAIEANSIEAEKAILDFAKNLSTKAFVAHESKRQQLHLAAVFANNFSNHLVGIAQDICAKEGIDFEYLHPLIQQTFERLKTENAKSIQTGPAIRNDKMTIQKHLQLLKDKPEWTLIYESLSTSIRKTYRTNEE